MRAARAVPRGSVCSDHRPRLRRLLPGPDLAGQDRQLQIRRLHAGEAGFGSVKNLTQLEKEILAKARELNIPLTKENLSVRRSHESITIEAHYQLTVDFFKASTSTSGN